MNGYLVLLRGHGGDDVPLRLCATEEEAVAFAAAFDPDALEEWEWAYYYDSTPCYQWTEMILFDYRDGRPWQVRGVRNFEVDPELFLTKWRECCNQTASR
jgi:hypothetical protein